MSELPELGQYFSNISYSAVICRVDNANLTEAQAEEIIRRCNSQPDLLKACEKIHLAIGEGNPIDITNICVQYVIPAIAKAISL